MLCSLLYVDLQLVVFVEFSFMILKKQREVVVWIQTSCAKTESRKTIILVTAARVHSCSVYTQLKIYSRT